MADLKISALTGASTPLAGTEVLPIVQSGSTVKVSVANLTTGRAISASAITASTGDITSTAGNFVVGTSGKGIDFSATPGTGTSELLADYEEGTWTPTAGANLTVVGTFSSSGKYTKIGRQVTVIGVVSASTSVAVIAGGIMCDGLPFTVSGFGLGNLAVSGAGAIGETLVVTTIVLSQTAIGPTAEIYFSATYFV